MKKDSGKSKPKRPPYEYVMLAFGLFLACVIAVILAPAYLVPKFRPTLREFFAPLKRFLPGGEGSGEPENFLE
jgi:hypothetical protein